MKPTKLAPGTKLLWPCGLGGQGRVIEFIKRVPGTNGRPAQNYVRVSAFAGLDGPDDDGTVVMNDWQIARRCRLYREEDEQPKTEGENGNTKIETD